MIRVEAITASMENLRPSSAWSAASESQTDASEGPLSGMKWATTLSVPSARNQAPVELPLLVARGAADGPHVVILGGVHGDEYEGITAAAAAWRDLDLDLLRGQVSIVPVANPPAYAAGTRTSPLDGLNLARE